MLRIGQKLVRVPGLPRNTTIPTSKKEIFSTAADSQTEVEIHILQGEREMASDNRTLGKFRLAGIPAARRGVPQIEVTFDIDANGILNVAALDKATNKKQSIVIQASSGLAKDEVERMVKDAGQYAENDKQRKSLAEARNQADQLIYSSENTVAELGDKVTPDEKGKINSALERLKKAKEKEDVAEIKSAMEELTKSSHTLAQKLYEQANKQTGGQAGGASSFQGERSPDDMSGTQEPPQQEQPPSGEKGKGKDGDNIIDAEFETKDK
ncbi:MAG: Hsp70 family protein [Planctomycetes bacterium]|nr:Hsp70 family protein [Planctomycetota bacterium]